jgi:hypothetical protein
VDFHAVEGLTAGVYACTAPWRDPWVAPIDEDGRVELPVELREAGPLLVSVRVDDPWVPFEWPRWPSSYLFVGGDGHLRTEDAEESALSQFLVGRGGFPTQLHDLRRFWVLTTLAGRLRAGYEARHLAASCANALRARPSEALAALAALGFEPDEMVAALVSSGLAARVVPNPFEAAEARRLWPMAPVLALFSGPVADPECREAAEAQCGDSLPAIIDSGVDPNAGVGRFGPEVSRLVTMQPQQIEGIWRAAQIVPQGLLDGDTRAVAARRLFDQRHDDDVRLFGRTAVDLTRSAFRLCAHRPRLRAQIEARMPAPGSQSWFTVPAASAACAIVARLAARGDERCRTMEKSFRADWARLANGAPDLVRTDLILAELLVSSEKAAQQ